MLFLPAADVVGAPNNPDPRSTPVGEPPRGGCGDGRVRVVDLRMEPHCLVAILLGSLLRSRSHEPRHPYLRLRSTPNQVHIFMRFFFNHLRRTDISGVNVEDDVIFRRTSTRLASSNGES